MEVKAIEIRDKGTFIPALAVLMVPMATVGIRLVRQAWHGEMEREHYLLRRAGFNFDSPCVILCRMEAAGCDRNATYDPYSWGGSRTYTVAHQYIIDHWVALESGAVVDVEFILGETTQPKKSERETAAF